jgi:hypothetical protein
MSNTQLKEQLHGQPARVQEEIVRINTDARLPDSQPSGATESLVRGSRA